MPMPWNLNILRWLGLGAKHLHSSSQHKRVKRVRSTWSWPRLGLTNPLNQWLGPLLTEPSCHGIGSTCSPDPTDLPSLYWASTWARETHLDPTNPFVPRLWVIKIIVILSVPIVTSGRANLLFTGFSSHSIVHVMRMRSFIVLITKGLSLGNIYLKVQLDRFLMVQW